MSEGTKLLEGALCVVQFTLVSHMFFPCQCLHSVLIRGSSNRLIKMQILTWEKRMREYIDSVTEAGNSSVNIEMVSSF